MGKNTATKAAQSKGGGDPKKKEDKVVNGVNEEKPAEEVAPKDVDLITLEDIREQIRHIEKAVSTKNITT